MFTEYGNYLVVDIKLTPSRITVKKYVLIFIGDILTCIYLILNQLDYMNCQ